MNESFADRLREAREIRGLSQSGLADLTGLKPSAINHFECGRRKPSIANLEKLLDALCVSADYLCGRAEKFWPSASESKTDTTGIDTPG